MESRIMDKKDDQKTDGSSASVSDCGNATTVLAIEKTKKKNVFKKTNGLGNTVMYHFIKQYLRQRNHKYKISQKAVVAILKLNSKYLTNMLGKLNRIRNTTKIPSSTLFPRHIELYKIGAN